VSDLDDIHQRLPGDLFSMDAADNVEVVPDVPPPGPESLWSTAANAEETVDPAQVGPSPAATTSDEDAAWASMGSPTPPRFTGTAAPSFARHGFGVGHPTDPATGHGAPTPVGAPGAGWVFRTEPVAADGALDDDEVIGEIEDEGRWFEPPPSASVFSSGPAATAAPQEGAPPSGSAARAASPFATPEDPWSEWGADEATTDPAGGPVLPPPFAGAAPAPVVPPAVTPDPHGLDVAVGRLHPDDRERSRVALTVCGAMLVPGEQVLGVVTGQMLGRPAAVVVTGGRVLVANDRRWQPVVDEYPIDERLEVRGRHDHQMAALSFSADERLTMVDGIAEVDLAVELAEVVRQRVAPDPSSEPTT
jgi:hypothetical protein